MMMINLSVIIPTFQRVKETLNVINLLNSSRGVGSEFDLTIIVADSSPDISLKKILRAKCGPNVTYTQPSKKGIAANKNQGASIAKTPIIAFCDTDVEVEPDTLLNSIESLKNHPTGSAVAGNVYWRGGIKDGKLDRPRVEDRILKIKDTNYIEALYSRFLMTYKDVFDDVGGYDEEVFNMRGEGSDLSTRYWREGYPLIFEPKVRVHHGYDAPLSAAIRVAHPTHGIAKDFLLLMYKYKMEEGDYPNLLLTMHKNFDILGNDLPMEMLRGMISHWDLLISSKQHLDEFRDLDKPLYDFKFLEIFSDKKLFEQCVNGAEKRLVKIREKTFTRL